ncbi:MAG: hypothetical protein QM764_24325, partial [Chitinophagaceae bacterium]
MRRTIQRTADELSSSPAIVSRTLNNYPRISAEDNRLVNKSKDCLNYYRNKSALSFCAGRSYTIHLKINILRYKLKKARSFFIALSQLLDVFFLGILVRDKEREEYITKKDGIIDFVSEGFFRHISHTLPTINRPTFKTLYK